MEIGPFCNRSALFQRKTFINLNNEKKTYTRNPIFTKVKRRAECSFAGKHQSERAIERVPYSKRLFLT